MKGPGMRLDLDVRRVWRCPTCGRERRTSGDHTVLRCVSCGERPWMSLVEQKRQPRTLRPRPEMIITWDADEADLSPVAAPERPAEPALEVLAQAPVAPDSVPFGEQTAKRARKRPRRRRSRRRSADGPSSPPPPQASLPSEPADSLPGESSQPGTAADQENQQHQ